MKYKFEILEKAIGKERPRWNGYKMYTPTKTVNFEEKVKWSFESKYNVETELSTKPFKAKITAIFEPTKTESKSKKKRQTLIDGINYTKKPDADNIAKAILDSLNGLAYKDDSQISLLLVQKDYGEENKIIVELEEI